MTSVSRRARWVAPPITIALTAGFTIALATPANAAHSVFSQSTPTFLGDGFTSTSQTTDIHVPATGSGPGVADVYPSQISFGHAATITDVNVVIQGFTSTAPTDLDVLLVGPGGQQALIMSDSGDSNDVSNVTFTLDDEAGVDLPDNNVGATGTFTNGSSYRPGNIAFGAPADDTLPPPAPALTGNSALSVFDGTLAAGTWKLYVNDDEAADTSTISGWALELGMRTDPYPSTLAVSGLPAVSDVNVTLTGVTSTFLDDVDLLLVGPGGQQVTLLSDAGDDPDVTGINLTFDDEAAAPVPDTPVSPVTSGSYQPTNYPTIADFYPAPAPVSTGGTSLAVFDGTVPNGQWRLFAQDDATSDNTVIGGWSLDLTFADTLAPSGTVAINGGAATTTSTSVSLNLGASDPAPGSGVAQMRFSNDGVTFSAYQPFAATAPWTLTSGDGTKTVYAQFKDADGNESAVANDTITLALPDTTGPKSTKTKPADKAKNVKVTAKVKVTASEALMASSVTKSTVILKAKGSSKKVKATVKYNAAKKKIILTPNKDLKKGTKYKVTVKTGVKDAKGNAWDENSAKAGAQALKFSFTTA